MCNPAANTPSTFKADALLILVTLLAAAGWIFSVEAVAGFAPLTFIGLRFTGAGLIVALLCLPSLRRLNRQQWRVSLQVGLLFGVAMVFWVIGLKHTTHISVSAFLCSLGLVMVPLISILFGDRPSLYVYCSLPFAAAGLGCLSLDDEFHMGLAESCFLIAALIFALMYILNSRAATHIPALPLSAIQLTLAGLITGVGALLFEDIHWHYSPALWGWFAASMLISTCMRFVLQTYALGLSPPSHSAIIMNLEPVWAAFLAAAWLHERMTGLQFLGCALIFVAMLVNRWPAFRLLLKH